MQTKCPNCGAIADIDLLITNDDARAAIAAVTVISGDLGKAVIRYCGLFRPSKSQLSFARLAKLINELLPDIQSQRIERNGQLFDAPLPAWLHAINVMLAKRDNNELGLPLKSHGYLYEIISKYKPSTQSVVVLGKPDNQTNSAGSGRMSERSAALQALKR